MLTISQVPRISAHFTAAEAACPCCGYLLVSDGMRRVAEAAEIVRAQIQRPLYVASWCRCPSRNRAVGGAANSRHMQGDAMDLYAHGVTPRQLRSIVVDLCPGIRGIGVGTSKFHMDARPGPKAEWTYR
jgi:uncharacterized protein YcbK (DUF882 family)